MRRDFNTIVKKNIIFSYKMQNNAGPFWNVLISNNLVMNVTSALLYDRGWIITCSKRHEQYIKTVKGFTTNSTDWLLSCMISHESLQTL